MGGWWRYAMVPNKLTSTSTIVHEVLMRVVLLLINSLSVSVQRNYGLYSILSKGVGRIRMCFIAQTCVFNAYQPDLRPLASTRKQTQCNS